VLVAITWCTRGYGREVEQRQLLAFVAVADELHFGRAAERMGLLQPAVSQLVRRLERDVGLTLFERSPHHVTLTAAGTALLEHARAAVAAHARAEEAAAAIRAGARGRLRIGTSDGLAPWLGPVLARFAERHPGVELVLEPARTPVKLARLRDGTLDVAFVHAPRGAGGLRLVRVWDEPLVVALPAWHRLARAPSVDLALLGELPLLLAGATAEEGVREELLDHCRRAGLEPRLGPPYRGREDALMTIASAGAWTYLRASSAGAVSDGVATVPVADPRVRAVTHLARRVVGVAPLVETLETLAVAAARRDG